MLACEIGYSVVIDFARLRVDTVLDSLKDLAGEIHFRSMRQMATIRQAHTEQRVTGLHHRQISGGVGLRARVRLHVGVICAEHGLGSVDRQLLGNVDVLAPAVVALARVTFGVLVRQYRTLCVEHAGARVVFRGDELDVIFLASNLALYCSVQLVVKSLDLIGVSKHRQLPSGKRR